MIFSLYDIVGQFCWNIRLIHEGKVWINSKFRRIKFKSTERSLVIQVAWI